MEEQEGARSRLTGTSAACVKTLAGMEAGMKLTKAQRGALEMVARRDWPAGEPRLGWIYRQTATVLLQRGLIAEREGTERTTAHCRKSAIVDLTDAGRKALSDA